jgi:membrane dipeptidase
VKRTLRLIDALTRTIDRSGGRMFLAVHPDDIRRADREGKVAALLGIEGGHAIQNDLGVLRMYHRLGVRYMTLTWSFNIDWADSSGEKAAVHGLTPFGAQVVREMNRLGMLVDISHVSDETFFDTMKAASAPVIASHSSCRALCDAPRNMTDEMLKAMAKNGGVVMINFFPAFIDQKFRDAATAADLTAKDRLKKINDDTVGDPVARENASWALSKELHAAIAAPSIEKVLDHIEHVIEVAGIDHVGLGSDFDGITATPAGLEDVTKLPSITRGLLERGYTDDEVVKILGGNFLRVFDRVTEIASAH